MDVNALSKVQSGSSAYPVAAAQSVQTAERVTGAEALAGGQTTNTAAYSVDISDAAQKASGSIKGLTSEQVDVLKDGIAKSQELMIKTLTAQNAKLQGFLDDNISALRSEGSVISTDRFALPAVGTTPEEAATAVADGGDWSVDAVSTRIFDLASTIAGGDADRLEQMRSAVEKGFEQAGIEFKEATGEEDTPQITKDTHAEIMKRFDDLAEQIKATKQNDETEALQKSAAL